METTPRHRTGAFGLDRRALWLISAFVAFVMVAATTGLVRSWLPARYTWLRVQGRVDARCSLALARAAEHRLGERIAIGARNRRDVRFSRESDGLRLYETGRGQVWTSPRDTDPVGSASTFHEARSIRWNVIDGVPGSPIRRGDIVLDAGAHIGESTFAALELGASRVVAIEPDPDNLAALRRNLEREIEDGRVIVVEKGVYDRVGALTFVHRETSRDGWFVDGPATGDSLPVTTVDRIVADLALPRLDFIKMDIEGSEIPALRGARDTMRRLAPRIAVGTYHKPDDLNGIEQIVVATQPTYKVTPSFCRDEYGGHEYGRMFPFLLFFSDGRG